jgi:hypothetical protein
MRLQRLKILVAGLLGAVCIVLAWELLRLPAGHPGGISVSFVGFSNAAPGVISAQFTASNTFRFKLICSTAAPQIRLTNGWSPGGHAGNPGHERGWSPASHYGYPGNAVFTVAPNGANTFAVVLSNMDGAVWRVPLAYDEVQPAIKHWLREFAELFRLPVAKPRGGYTTTPAIVGLSNYMVQPTGASRLGQETERTSAAADSRRSP